MCVSEDEKTKCIQNPFSWLIWNNYYVFILACATKRVPLFEHVHQIEVTWVW